MSSRTDPELLAVARGDRPADLVLRGGRIVNVFTRRLEPGAVAISGERIAAVGPERDLALEGREVIDLGGRVLAPGLIDAHMHLESTMMLPAHFVRVAAAHGTTGVVLDPHEIANVCGIEGVRFLMDASRGLPMNIMFAAPSCVPCSPLETAGGAIDLADLERLFEDERVVALAEMMNVPGVVGAVPEVIEKVRLGLARRIVDGHCPEVTGPRLQAYVAAGVGSDHESTRAEEAAEKLRLGMQLYLREGSAARNLEALVPVLTAANAHQTCLCTDDRHPADLRREGHLDHVVRKAVRLGLDAPTALAMGSLHTARHFRQDDLGAIAPGRYADLIVLDDLADVRVGAVYFHGRLIAEHGELRVDLPDQRGAVPPALRGTVRLPDALDATSFRVPARDNGVPVRGVRIRVIGMQPGQLLTRDLHLAPKRAEGCYVADLERDILRLAVIERHRGTGNVGLGFVQGFGFRRGAMASSVGHDSHNLTVVGTNETDMLVAARALAEAGGGQCVVADGSVRALLPLPIAGLLSEEPADVLVAQQERLHQAARAIGCGLDDPFMPLSFLSLTVIPRLKLSDRGLVDVDRFEVVPLEAEQGF